MGAHCPTCSNLSKIKTCFQCNKEYVSNFTDSTIRLCYLCYQKTLRIEDPADVRKALRIIPEVGEVMTDQPYKDPYVNMQVTQPEQYEQYERAVDDRFDELLEEYREVYLPSVTADPADFYAWVLGSGPRDYLTKGVLELLANTDKPPLSFKEWKLAKYGRPSWHTPKLASKEGLASISLAAVAAILCLQIDLVFMSLFIIGWALCVKTRPVFNTRIDIYYSIIVGIIGLIVINPMISLMISPFSIVTGHALWEYHSCKKSRSRD